MTDTTDSAVDGVDSGPAPDSAPGAKPTTARDSSRSGGGLQAMKLPELRDMAAGLGIKSSGLKKADLVNAIKGLQGQKEQGGRGQWAGRQAADGDQPPKDGNDAQAGPGPDTQAEKQSEQDTDRPTGRQARNRNRPQSDQQDKQQDTQPDKQQDKQQDKQSAGQGGQNGPNNQPSGTQQDADGDDDGGSRRNRRRRGRDRQTPRAQGRSEPDTTILDDDVLTPCAGIIDVLENYAFVRTTGYLPGPDDVYVSLSMVRKMGLRRGDAVTGQVRQPRDGERREKFNPLVKVDSVNGHDPDEGRVRKDFDDLTPLYPTERLRLETTPDNLTGRLIDIAAPVGKGQRGLIVSPPRAGKTMVLRSIAASVAANNPECHLMVVLIDERPEEVTDFERSIKGEVVSSTFDRPPSDHTTVVELAIERAKRLVELDHDVVVLFDGLTRLTRAYHLAVGSSQHSGQVPGRALAGGVDSSALYPVKRLFGAARNVENGGSLTILATALVESGSVVDEVILEELQGTDNAELRLSRSLADRRLFPAVDLLRSGTRREEDLLAPEELQIIGKLRRALGDLSTEHAYEVVRSRLDATSTNYAFLTQVRDTPAERLAKE